MENIRRNLLSTKRRRLVDRIDLNYLLKRTPLLQTSKKMCGLGTLQLPYDALIMIFTFLEDPTELSHISRNSS